MNQQARTSITDVMTIGVPVSDQDKAVAFYVEQLGFEKRRDMPLPQVGARWIEVAPESAAISVALVAAREDAPVGVNTGIRFATGDAAAVHSDLQSRGIDVGELLRWPGVPPMFLLRDPDGNRLTVVEDA